MYVRFYVHTKYFLCTILWLVKKIDVSKQRRNINTSTTLNKKDQQRSKLREVAHFPDKIVSKWSRCNTATPLLLGT